MNRKLACIKNSKLARIKNNLTQREVCKMVGISNVTLINIERGNVDNVKFGTLKKIAEVLGSTVQELFLSDEN